MGDSRKVRQGLQLIFIVAKLVTFYGWAAYAHSLALTTESCAVKTRV